ncbi:flowering time control protein FCA-like isoform X2 [Cornus florida]|uniref:flowering time control protein FCA-like isoform X2 n=1 Tax=Cornus florida TaxID=4283 RepID=UPI00289A44A0|nr:flowering time control protein FCA-like isoform X2 [Cornus florida]
MDRHKGDRYGDYSDSHRNTHFATSSRSVDEPVSRHDRNYDNNYGGSFSGDVHRRHNHHSNSSGEQNDSIGCGGDGDFGSRQFSLSGRKRHFSPDYVDGVSYVKLFVGAVPRTTREENIRSLFGEYGNIFEVVLLKDKRTGQQQECCFVKYTTVEEADRAIGALHNQYTFPGGVVPIRVRYAEGERERLGNCPMLKKWASGTHVFKLYVGSLNKQATKREIEEIFSAYGLVEEVYFVRDEQKQNRGCGFVQFSHRDMAVAAINALNGTYVMRGCDQPLIVRFADPKKPRTGELRGNSRVGGPGFGPRFQESVRPAPYLSDPITGQKLPNVSHPPSLKSLISSSQDCPIRATASPASDSLQGNGFPSSAQQFSQAGSKLQTVSGTSTVSELLVPSTISSAPALPISTQTAADPLDCDWSEHICPDGYNYYYNCVTCESSWEKPEEYTFYEQQLEKQQQRQLTSRQQLHSLSNMQGFLLHVGMVWFQELGHMQVQAATIPLVTPACV